MRIIDGSGVANTRGFVVHRRKRCPVQWNEAGVGVVSVKFGSLLPEDNYAKSNVPSRKTRNVLVIAVLLFSTN